MSTAPLIDDGAVHTAMTVLASCPAGASARCEDVANPLELVTVVVLVLTAIALLTVAAVLGTDPRRRDRPRRRR